jgi:hypothetical protein
MATSEKTKAEIRATIQTQLARLATLPKGSPESKAIYERIIKNRQLIGLSGNATYADVYKSATAANAPAPTSDKLSADMNLGKKTEKVIDAQQAAADLAAKKNVQLGNAAVQRNPYGEQTITTDAQGNIIQETKLSDPQQNILNQGQNLTTTGQGLAQNTLGQFQAGFNPETAQRVSTGDLAADRARIEEEVFGRLTRGLDERKGNEQQQMEQTLRNRGIPLGSKQWNDQMAEFNKRYDTQIADARAQAAQMGGEEYSRNFGINEQLIANQISQGQAVRNQNLGEASALQGMGTGLMQPQFQGYQGTTYNTPDVLGAFSTVQGINLGKTDQQIEREKIEAQKQMHNQTIGVQQASLANRSGGGSAPQQPSVIEG